MAYKVKVERFDSIAQMTTVINSRTENKVFSGRTLSSRGGDKEFTRTESYEEAERLLANGWEEPLDKIKKGVADGFKANTTLNKSRPQTGIVGYAPCVPNAILGLPNSMIMTEKTPSKVKAIRILYSPSVTADVDEDDIFKSGVVVMNIVNDLELAGYRVRLDIEFFGSKKDNEIVSAIVNVKDYRQPLDLKKLAFPISHPSMFRRLGFRWLETYPQLENSGFRGGYGTDQFGKDFLENKKGYEENKILEKNEYLITTYLCRNKRFDKEEIKRVCGIAEVQKEKKAS